jgi:hypothetical protein
LIIKGVDIEDDEFFSLGAEDFVTLEAVFICNFDIFVNSYLVDDFK